MTKLAAFNFQNWIRVEVQLVSIVRDLPPLYSHHELLTPPMAELVGAKESEVVCMNSLTTNIHLLFVSLYRPTNARYKIISASKMFPSDRYLLETQVQYHGFDPDDAIIEVAPRDEERLIREEDILAAIEANADEVAMVFFGGVNYFTGQLFDLSRLTKAAHSVGAIAGFDLAHAAGNVPLPLHEFRNAMAEGNEQALLRFLKDHELEVELHRHRPVFTCDDAFELVPELQGQPTKNLFLSDPSSNRYFLVVIDPRRKIDLHALGLHLGVSRLTFVPPERLKLILGIDPGSVSMLALLHDVSHEVELLVDSVVWRSDAFLCHPTVNTATVVISRAALIEFLRLTGHEASVLNLPSQKEA